MERLQLVESEGNAAAPTCVPPKRGSAWQDEAPTRPVHTQTTLDVASHRDARDDGSALYAPTGPSPSMTEVVLDSRAERRPRRRIGWVAVMVAVSASMCIIAAAVVARVRELRHAAPDSAAVLDARPVALVASVPVEPIGPSGPQTAHSVTPEPLAAHPPDTGELQLTSATRGQPIFVDGHPVAAGPGNFRLSCGRHTIRVGSRGKSQTVVVPCGGSLTLTP